MLKIIGSTILIIFLIIFFIKYDEETGEENKVVLVNNAGDTHSKTIETNPNKSNIETKSIAVANLPNSSLIYEQVSDARGKYNFNDLESYRSYDDDTLENLFDGGDYRAFLVLWERSRVGHEVLEITPKHMDLFLTSIARNFTVGITALEPILQKRLTNTVNSKEIGRIKKAYISLLSVYELGVLKGDMSFLLKGNKLRNNFNIPEEIFLAEEDFNLIKEKSLSMYNNADIIREKKSYPVFNNEIYPSDQGYLIIAAMNKDKFNWGHKYLYENYTTIDGESFSIETLQK